MDKLKSICKERGMNGQFKALKLLQLVGSDLCRVTIQVVDETRDVKTNLGVVKYVKRINNARRKKKNTNKKLLRMNE